MYDHYCDYCDKGWIRCVVEPREVFKVHRTGGCVALEQVPVGVCDKCGERYYHSSVYRQAEALRRRQSSTGKPEILVAQYEPVP